MKPFSDKEMRRWHAIFRLLSLDCALPLWKQMGLNLTEDEQYFVLYAARLGHMIVQDGARNYYDANYSKVANSVEFFRSLLVTYKGNDFYQQVHAWCEHDFVQNESLKMSVEESWKIAFVKLAKNYPKLSCSLELPDEKAKWLISKIERLALVDERLNNFIDSSTKGDKTKWDQAIYEGSLSPEWEEHKPEEETTFYALLDASNAIQKKVLNKHVIDIWTDIRAEFSNEEINNLINWYKCDMESLIKIFPDLDTAHRATLMP